MTHFRKLVNRGKSRREEKEKLGTPGQKREAVSNWRVEEERKQITESLILNSISPQQLNLHVKFCIVFRVFISPYSSLIHTSLSSEIPICEVITWFQSYSGSNGSHPSECSIYNSLTSRSFLGINYYSCGFEIYGYLPTSCIFNWVYISDSSERNMTKQPGEGCIT